MSIWGKNGESQDAWESRDAQRPQVGEGVFVENEGRTRFAYLDGDGKWRDYYNGDLLRGKVELK